jgi:hypothetical protein
MKIAMQLASKVHHLRPTGFRDYTRAWRESVPVCAAPASAAMSTDYESLIPVAQAREMIAAAATDSAVLALGHSITMPSGVERVPVLVSRRQHRSSRRSTA